jgi:hypothetical protein
LAHFNSHHTGTGVFQPADVGLQRILKHRIKQDMLTHLVNEHARQLDAGIPPDSVKFDTRIAGLRDATVASTLAVWEIFNANPDIVKKVCVPRL